MAAQGRIEEAVSLARRAVRLAPDDEPSFRRLLTALDAAGDRAGAAQAFEAFTHRLEAEYAVEASAETQTLMQSIRDRETTNGHTPHAAPPAVVVAETPMVKNAGSAANASVAVAARARPRLRTSIVVGATLGAMVVLVSIVALRARDEPLLAGERVIVAPFANLTGDQSLDGVGLVAADWITQGIVRTGFVDVVSSVDAMRSAQLLETGPASQSPGAPALALARELKVRALVAGSFYRNDGKIAFQAQIIDADNGAVLRVIDGVSAEPKALNAALERLQQRVLGALGTFVDTRLVSLTRGTTSPPDFEAYRLFSEGMREFLTAATESSVKRRRPHYLSAADKFQAANARDTTFTLPLIWAAFARFNSGTGAGEAFQNLEQAHHRMPPIEQNMADYLLANHVRRNSEESYQAAKKVIESEPNSAWRFQLAQAASRTSRFREAVAALSSIDPDHGWMKEWPLYWNAFSNALHHLGDCKRQVEVLNASEARFPGGIEIADLSVAHMCAGSMNRALAFIDSVMVEADGWLPRYILTEFRTHGRRAVADSLTQAFLKRVQASGGSLAKTPEKRLQLGGLLYDAGQLDAARSVMLALRAEPGHPFKEDTYKIPLFIAIRQNDQVEGAQLLAHLEERRPAELPMILAQRALMLGQSAQALEILVATLDRLGALPDLHMYPDLMPLTADPRIQRFIARRN